MAEVPPRVPPAAPTHCHILRGTESTAVLSSPPLETVAVAHGAVYGRGAAARAAGGAHTLSHSTWDRVYSSTGLPPITRDFVIARDGQRVIPRLRRAAPALHPSPPTRSA